MIGVDDILLLKKMSEALNYLVNKYEKEAKEAYNRGLTKTGTAQDDWDDIMRGRFTTKKTQPIYKTVCESCGKTIIGSYLDHGIYRFKCMNCGLQWHKKTELGSNID